MLLSRRTLLGVAGATVPALALGATASAAPPKPGVAPPADLTTPDGWLTWIGRHRHKVTIELDNGRGVRLSHRRDEAQPLASAIKIVHLAAFATAVAEGRLDPKERVRVGDWERFYTPTDGGAHPAALKELGIPTDATGLYAADPNALVTVEQMAAAMIHFSDSAAPDFLRDRLGIGALRRAAEAGGWPRPDVRSLCGEYLFLVFPEHAPPPGASVPQRRDYGFRLERRYSSNPAMRQEALDRLMKQFPPWKDQLRWASGTMEGDARHLARIHHSISSGKFRPHRAAEIAREIVERPFTGQLPPGIVGMGFKGGNLPGVLTGGLTLRRSDGSVAAGSMLIHGGISAEQMSTGNPVLALRLGLDDSAWRDRLSDVLRV